MSGWIIGYCYLCGKAIYDNEKFKLKKPSNFVGKKLFHKKCWRKVKNIK